MTRRLALTVSLATLATIASTAHAQEESRAGHVVLEAGGVLLGDAISLAAGAGAYAAMYSLPCESESDFIDGCALSAVAVGIAAGHVASLLTAPLFVDLAGGGDGSYWAAVAWGALGMGVGLGAGIGVMAVRDDGDATLYALIGLPVLGQTIGAIAGYESTVTSRDDVDTRPDLPPLAPTVTLTAGGATVGATGTF